MKTNLCSDLSHLPAESSSVHFCGNPFRFQSESMRLHVVTDLQVSPENYSAIFIFPSRREKQLQEVSLALPQFSFHPFASVEMRLHRLLSLHQACLSKCFP